MKVFLFIIGVIAVIRWFISLYDMATTNIEDFSQDLIQEFICDHPNISPTLIRKFVVSSTHCIFFIESACNLIMIMATFYLSNII